MMIKLRPSILGSHVACAPTIWFKFAIMIWASLVMGCAGIDAEEQDFTTKPAAPVVTNEGSEPSQVDAGANNKSGFTWEDWHDNRMEVLRANDAAESSGEGSEFESKRYQSASEDSVTERGADSTGTAR